MPYTSIFFKDPSYNQLQQPTITTNEDFITVADEMTIRPRQRGTYWDNLTITINPPVEQLKEKLEKNDHRINIILEFSTSRHRIAETLEYDHHTIIEINRDKVYGEGILMLHVLERDKYGDYTKKVAELGQRWKIILDQIPRSRDIKILFRSFSEPENVGEKLKVLYSQNQNAFVDIDTSLGEIPILYINRDIQGIENFLREEGMRGDKKHIQRFINMYIHNMAMLCLAFFDISDVSSIEDVSVLIDEGENLTQEKRLKLLLSDTGKSEEKQFQDIEDFIIDLLGITSSRSLRSLRFRQLFLNIQNMHDLKATIEDLIS